ncbi:MAG: sigma-54 dependent transcriptional regulator [Thermoanaerobaculia bacterium]|nr:sigma-54 dependent transcriptional regulator [Thermoanaerobaculia bacterium]
MTEGGTRRVKGAPRVLVADDDATVVASLRVLLSQAGYEVSVAEDAESALARASVERIDLVLQDMNFSRQTSGEEGLALLEELRRQDPELPVILMTAWGSIDLAVAGMKLGAVDFVSKPWSNPHLLASVATALALSAVAESEEADPRREELDERLDLEGLIGRDPEFLRVLALVGRVAATDASVLITGESGTGKELIAAAVHANSRRRQAPFVKVNLGGISSTLFESEMFGHVRGAFTDARRDREGRFALAEGGTIFLDEIGEVDPSSQVKLLRVLQDRTYEVLGSSQPRAADVRVVSATNADLPQRVRQGQFREDLLYRLNLIAVRLPPLRDRRDDIPLLTHHILAGAAERYAVAPPEVTASGLTWLRRQAWPGNVRQLVQTLERAVLVLGERPLDAAALESLQIGESTRSDDVPRPGRMTLSEVERRMIVESLRHYDGNLTRVAEALGLSRQALYRRLEKYGLSPDDMEGDRPVGSSTLEPR